MFVKESKNKSIFKTYMIYFICMLCFLAVRIAYSNGLLRFGDEVFDDIFIGLIIQVGIMFLLPMVLYCNLMKVKPKNVFNTCNYYKLNKRAILICFAIGIIAFLINIASSTFFNVIIHFFGYESSSGVSTKTYSIANFIVDLVITALLPALCEEFLHRGILLQGTKHMGFGKAIILSSLMFGFMHFNINQFFYAFIVGILMGLISVVAKNIWPAVIVHFTNNAIGVYLEYATANKWFGGNFYNVLNNFFSSTSLIFTFLIVFIALSLIFILLTYLIFLLYKLTILRKVEKAINEVYSSDSVQVKNSPISLKDQTAVKNIVESTTTLNLDFENMKNPIEVVMPKQPNIYNPTLKDKTFLIGSFVLGFLVTFFTFLWGVIYWK